MRVAGENVRFRAAVGLDGRLDRRREAGRDLSQGEPGPGDLGCRGRGPGKASNGLLSRSRGGLPAADCADLPPGWSLSPDGRRALCRLPGLPAKGGPRLLPSDRLPGGPLYRPLCRPPGGSASRFLRRPLCLAPRRPPSSPLGGAPGLSPRCPLFQRALRFAPRRLPGSALDFSLCRAFGRVPGRALCRSLSGTLRRAPCGALWGAPGLPLRSGLLPRGRLFRALLPRAFLLCHVLILLPSSS